jgi:hypothetical protein
MPRQPSRPSRRQLHELPVPRVVQPDDTTCGPSCLAQVAGFFGQQHTVPALAAGLSRLHHGGTLGVFLALRAMELGFEAAVYPLGVRVFDPTWWQLDAPALVDRLHRRRDTLTEPLDREVIDAWVRFLRAGGHLRFAELTPALLRGAIDRGHPLICGLNVTWLYRESREQDDGTPDDVGGEQVGHFVTIAGYSGGGRRFDIRDPHWEAPYGVDGHYRVGAWQLIHAILIGDRTRDAVLVELWPAGGP